MSQPEAMSVPTCLICGWQAPVPGAFAALDYHYGVVHPDADFFEEDEPIEDVIAAFEAAEKHLTEPPAHGVGWCAPSP